MTFLKEILLDRFHNQLAVKNFILSDVFMQSSKIEVSYIFYRHIVVICHLLKSGSILYNSCHKY